MRTDGILWPNKGQQIKNFFSISFEKPEDCPTTNRTDETLVRIAWLQFERLIIKFTMEFLLSQSHAKIGQYFPYLFDQRL